MDCDAKTQTELSPANIKYFKDFGVLVIRNALCPEELEALRAETKKAIDEMPNDPENPDFWYNNEIPEMWYKNCDNESPEIRRGVPFRIEYPVDKGQACKELMGHPLVLKATEQLLETKEFIPTWDSLVWKQAGEGVPIKWHRDASAESVDNTPAIDIGYYLDEANKEMNNCLWAIPGSQKWPDFLAANMIEFLSSEGFKKAGAVPIEVKPGDVIFHNILVVHGSASCLSPLRRTVYYEYRAIAQELKMGPHKPEYIPHKKKLLQACIHERSKRETAYDAIPAYDYQPGENLEPYDPANPMPTMRFVHKEFFRADYKG